MTSETHRRARDWIAGALGATDVGPGVTYHLTAGNRRIRVAGRHVRDREPNFFSVGETLAGKRFDELGVVLFEPDWSVRYAYCVPLAAVIEHHKQPGRQGCRLMIKGDDSWRSDPRTVPLD